MTKERLKQILDERNSNPQAFARDGHQYFNEFLPIIEKGLERVELPKVRVPDLPLPKKPQVELHPERIAPVIRPALKKPLKRK